MSNTYADLYPDDFQSWLDNCGMELDEKQIAQIRQRGQPDSARGAFPIQPVASQPKMGKSRAGAKHGQ